MVWTVEQLRATTAISTSAAYHDPRARAYNFAKVVAFVTRPQPTGLQDGKESLDWDLDTTLVKFEYQPAGAAGDTGPSRTAAAQAWCALRDWLAVCGWSGIAEAASVCLPKSGSLSHKAGTITLVYMLPSDASVTAALDFWSNLPPTTHPKARGVAGGARSSRLASPAASRSGAVDLSRRQIARKPTRRHSAVRGRPSTDRGRQAASRDSEGASESSDSEAGSHGARSQADSASDGQSPVEDDASDSESEADSDDSVEELFDPANPEAPLTSRDFKCAAAAPSRSRTGKKTRRLCRAKSIRPAAGIRNSPAKRARRELSLAPSPAAASEPYDGRASATPVDSDLDLSGVAPPVQRRDSDGSAAANSTMALLPNNSEVDGASTATGGMSETETEPDVPNVTRQRRQPASASASATSDDSTVLSSVSG